MPRPPSHFVWYELITSDVDAAERFYGAVIGWKSQNSGTPGMDYRQWTASGTPVGGLMTIPPEAAANGMRPCWMGYLNVTDLDASVADMQKAGGIQRMPSMDIPGVGRIAVLTDPQGAGFYLIQPAMEGTSTVFSPGKTGHGGWHELHTTDWQAALAFYSTQFGWAKTDALDMGPMGTYLLFNAGGDAIGGMMNSPNFPHPAWLYYFNVEDIRTAKTRVEAAGGTILMGPQEVPGGMWILQALDPQGAMFALLAPAKP